MSKPTIHVAIAILLHQDQVLVGWREATQHQGNKYEFPGGKVEETETPLAACCRETQEEVGIYLSDWHAFDVIAHEYDDVLINLHVFHATVPADVLAQIQAPWRWYQRDALPNLNFPSANHAIIQRLYWPRQIKISERLTDLSQLPVHQLMYWRVETNQTQLIELAELSVDKISSLIVNVEMYQQLNSIQQQTIAAIHLKQNQVCALKAGDLVKGKRYLAACHDLASMQQAQQIGCDALLLSSVHTTPTHADAVALGWPQFKALAAAVDIPVFALGGMRHDDLDLAQQHGAYGIAGIRFL